MYHNSGKYKTKLYYFLTEYTYPTLHITTDPTHSSPLSTHFIRLFSNQ